MLEILINVSKMEYINFLIHTLIEILNTQMKKILNIGSLEIIRVSIK